MTPLVVSNLRLLLHHESNLAAQAKYKLWIQSMGYFYRVLIFSELGQSVVLMAQLLHLSIGININCALAPAEIQAMMLPNI